MPAVPKLRVELWAADTLPVAVWVACTVPWETVAVVVTVDGEAEEVITTVANTPLPTIKAPRATLSRVRELRRFR